MKNNIVECEECGATIDIGNGFSADKEHDSGNWKIYCVDCGKKHIQAEIDKVYGKKRNSNTVV